MSGLMISKAKEPREKGPGRNAGPKIGLALGGGGLRGVAHIGVLQVFHEEGVRPHILSGTSAGSIVATLYAAGMDPSEMEKTILNVKKDEIFDVAMSLPNLLLMAAKVIADWLGMPGNPLGSAPNGFVKGDKAEACIDRLTGGKTFNELSMPAAVVAVDVNSGETVVFLPDEAARQAEPLLAVEGLDNTALVTGITVSEAVRASISIPGLFRPKIIQGRTLVDGGIKDVVPAAILRCLGADVVIAIDLGYAGQRAQAIDNIVEILSQSLDIMGRELADAKLDRYAHVRIKPRIYNVGLGEFERIPECLARGREAARLALPEIRDIISRIGK